MLKQGKDEIISNCLSVWGLMKKNTLKILETVQLLKTLVASMLIPSALMLQGSSCFEYFLEHRA